MPTTYPALSIPVRMRAPGQFAGRGICIALIDSGFFPHPDLVQPRNRIACYYDAVHRAEAAMPPAQPAFFSWHGTMTACTAAGNGWMSRHQYSSLAAESSVVLVRTMHDSGNIPTATIAHALDWIEENRYRLNIRVVNLSVYADEQDLSLNHPVTQRIERLSKAGICVVAAAGNDASVMLTPPAVAPSAITVGGLDDRNSIERRDNTMYPSSFGATIHGSVKPEVIAPAIWLPAPMIPGTATQREASALVALDSLDNEQMMKVLPMLITSTELPLDLLKSSDPEGVRQHIENRIQKMKIISPHYQHVDGTSFAAPIVCSVIAQMLEANPLLTPDEVKNILMSTAERLPNVPAYRQGAGMVDPPAAVEAASDAEQFRVTSI